ncbi:P-loop containing nucleoside triphosphate hydrolase protein, partial [Xylaria grammica]
MVRVRPALASEAGMETARIWRDGADGRVRVRWPRDDDRAAGKNNRRTTLPPSPVVDHLFPPDAPNEAVFAEVEDLLYMAADGAADVCVLVYGPTGSGKSYTMGHVVEAAARKIFRRAGRPHRHHGDQRGEEEEEEGVRVTARYIECYQEALYDLFGAYTPEEEGAGTDAAGRRGAGPTKKKEKKLELRQDEARQRTEVTQAVTPVFRDAAALLRGLAEADGRRKTATTKLNARSSRSHAILTLYLDRHRDDDDGGENAREARMAALSRDGSTRLKPGFRAGEEGEQGDLGATMTGRSITLVDLAGSEPLNQHDDDQQHGESTAQARREETKKINLSLHELRNVISQLSAPLAQPPPSRSLSSGDKEQQQHHPNPNPGATPQTNTKKTKTTTTTTTTKKEGKGFVPYNNSKLTRLLKYSLGFGARTLFLVCVSPLAAHAARTEASLEFAACVSFVRVYMRIRRGI